MSHFKMATFLADRFVILFTYYRPPASDVFLWIYRPLYRTYLFIVNGADLEYTKNITNFMVNDVVLEYIY